MEKLIYIVVPVETLIIALIKDKNYKNNFIIIKFF